MSLFKYQISFESELSLTQLSEKILSNVKITEYYNLFSYCKNDASNSIEMILKPKYEFYLYRNTFRPILIVRICENNFLSRVMVTFITIKFVQRFTILYFSCLLLFQVVLLEMYCLEYYSLDFASLFPTVLAVFAMVIIKICEYLNYKNVFNTLFYGIDAINLQKNKCS